MSSRLCFSVQNTPSPHLGVSLVPQFCGHALVGEPTTCFPPLQLPVPIKRHLEAERRWAPSADIPKIRLELLSVPSPRMKTLFAFLFLVVSFSLAVEGLSESLIRLAFSSPPPPLQPSGGSRQLSGGLPSGTGGSVLSHGGDVPTLCCFAYMAGPIPLYLLKTFEYTNGRCSQPAVM
ncbi:C-C motif chemokine 3-like [Crotalus adamanteus]|uniref:C-C motif chemokine 3-like n=1 Tax=Crotalus adamanteus TaxID=8729 RepID=A0AAW1C2V0_CROAD